MNKERFDEISDNEYLKFDRIPIEDRPSSYMDICAFLYLEKKFGPSSTKSDMITCAQHDIFYLDYEQTFHPYFTDDMIEEIYTSNVRYVRVHTSGDFFSREYVLQWKCISSELSDVIFRTNTRRRDMLQLMRKEFPDNFIVRESTDPTRKVTGHFPQHAIIGTPGSKDFFVCKNDCKKCKFYCWKNPEANIVTEKIL